MSRQVSGPAFAVITARQVQHVLAGNERHVVSLVESAYRLHAAGQTVVPQSQFLRLPERPSARIIALTASIGGESPVAGMKWISSFPGNVAAGLPRASAVLILNDTGTGYPFACLESSVISAARTAASATLAADRLTSRARRPRRAGFVGTGLIARYIHSYLARTGWTFDEIGVHDLVPRHAARFGGYLDEHAATSGTAVKITVYDRAEDLIRASDLVVFATVAPEPHVRDPAWFAHHPVVLHVSLRDLAPRIVLASANVVDDTEHCLRAGTSVHLAEQLTGGREFIDGTLAEVLSGQLRLRDDRTVIFSPFGLGVLDLAVGRFVYDELRASGSLALIDGFFPCR